MCSHDGVRGAPQKIGHIHLKWSCPRNLPRESCGVCDGYSACMEEAWGLFTKLMEAHKLG
jgi:hypothetical protein